MLSVPLVRQERPWSCGAAALLAVLRYWKVDNGVTEDDLLEPLGTTAASGTEPDKIADVARYFGLRAEFERGGVTFDRLARELEVGSTVILAVQAWASEHIDYTDECGSGHYLVLVGLDRSIAYFMDPSAEGGYTFIPVDELRARWHDVESGECVSRMAIIVRGADHLTIRPEPVRAMTEMVTFDSTPYRNVRLLDTARLLSGAVHAKPLNPKLVTKLIGRLVGGLEASVIGVEGRADADRFSKMIRNALSELVTGLRDVLPEDHAPFHRLAQEVRETWDIRILKRPGERDPSERAVAAFERACGVALESFRRLGVADKYISGIVVMQPGTRKNPAGMYLGEDDSVRINSYIFEEPEHQAENLAEWAIIHEVAHRVWYRLTNEARDAWVAFIEEHKRELPTKYAEKAGPDEAWADAVADLALLPEGGVGDGSSEIVRRGVRFVLGGATAEAISFDELREVWNALAPLLGKPLHEMGGKADDPPKRQVIDAAKKFGGEIDSTDTRMSGELPVKFKGQWQAWQFIQYLAKAWGHLGDKLRRADAAITLPSGTILFVPVREMTP